MRFPIAIDETAVRFHVVMERTIRELMSLRRMAVIIIVGLLPAAFLSLLMRGMFKAGDLSLEMQTHLLLGYFMILYFMMAMAYLGYFVVATSGQELVAKEEEKGTLLLMVSKPISRFQFLLGKFLALVLTTLLLGLIVLLGSILVLRSMVGLDIDTVGTMLGLVPWIFLLCVITVLFFAAVSMALSALIKSNTIRGILMMLIVALILGAGSGIRMMYPNVYEGYGFYLFDGGYHLGNSYLFLLDQVKGSRMTPQTQVMLGAVTGTYKADLMTALFMFFGGSELMGSTAFDPEIGGLPPSLEKTAYLNPLISIALCILASGAAFGVANVALNRKEIQ